MPVKRHRIVHGGGGACAPVGDRGTGVHAAVRSSQPHLANAPAIRPSPHQPSCPFRKRCPQVPAPAKKNPKHLMKSGGGCSQSSTTRPPIAPACGCVRIAFAIARSHPGSSRLSSSTKAIQGALVSRTPRRRAGVSPCWFSRTRRSPGTRSAFIGALSRFRSLCRCCSFRNARWRTSKGQKYARQGELQVARHWRLPAAALI